MCSWCKGERQGGSKEGGLKCRASWLDGWVLHKVSPRFEPGGS